MAILNNQMVEELSWDLYIWVNFITTSLISRTLGIMVFIWGIIPFYGRKIQVCELLSFNQIHCPNRNRCFTY